MSSLPFVCDPLLCARISIVLSDGLKAMREDEPHDFGAWAEWRLDDDGNRVATLEISPGIVRIHHERAIEGRTSTVGMALSEDVDQSRPDLVEEALIAAIGMCARRIDPDTPEARTLSDGLHALALDMIASRLSVHDPMERVRLVCGIRRPSTALVSNAAAGRPRRMRADSPLWDFVLGNSPFVHAVANVLSEDASTVSIAIAGAVAEASADDVTPVEVLRRLPTIPPALKAPR